MSDREYLRLFSGFAWLLVGFVLFVVFYIGYKWTAPQTDASDMDITAEFQNAGTTGCLPDIEESTKLPSQKSVYI